MNKTEYILEPDNYPVDDIKTDSNTNLVVQTGNTKIVIPSTFYNLEEFQTEPSIKTKEDLLMSYEYGTYKDNELKQAIEIVKSRKLEQENNISFQ